MTLELADGRGELFQWDAGRIIEFGDDTVSQAHFTSIEKITDIPYTIEVKNRKAAIPDELLQVPGTLIVYAWVSDTNGGYTKVQVNFPVFARPKPLDYVYTPTEHAGFDRLRAEIGDLGDLQTDAKDTLVAAINEAAASGGADLNQFEINAESGDQINDYEYQVTLDKTYEEIDAAFQSGRTPIVILDNRYRLPVISIATGYHFGAFSQLGPGVYGVFDVYVSNREEWLLELPIVDYANLAPFVESVEATIGDLSTLQTTTKDNLVAAINEVALAVAAGSMDLRVADGHIQYSTDSGSTWTNLIAVAELKGAKGDKGDPGEKGDTGATGLQGETGPAGPVGPQGPAGAPGKDGADGKPGAAGAPGKDGTNGITPSIGTNGNWYIGNTDTGKPSRGAKGDTGASGEPGKDGKDGSDATVTAASITGALGYKPAAPSDIPVVPIAEISANTAARHSHANKDVLDGITGQVTADKVYNPDHVTDLVQYAAFQVASQQIISQIPTVLPSPNALTVTCGSNSVTYDGSADKIIDIPSVEKIVTETTQVLPAYTNLIPISTDASGAVLNGVGYEAGALHSDGTVASASSFTSGFIPVKKGDVVRIKDPGAASFSLDNTVALYKADKAASNNIGKTANAMQANAAYGGITISGDVLTWDTSSISYYFWQDFSYLRVMTSSADSIVTINEEIKESTQTVMSLKPTVKVGKGSLDFAINEPLLAGRKIVVFGDSLIGMTRDQTSVPAYAAAYTGAKVYNVGFGGCRMAKHPSNGYAAFSMWALADAVASGDYSTQDAQAPSGQDYFANQLDVLKSIDFTTVDAIVIHYGTNDFAANVPLDDVANLLSTDTVCGALRYSIKKLLTAFPKIKIFVSLPLYRTWDGVGSETYKNALEKTLPEYDSAMKTVAEEHNLPTVDGYKQLGINSINSSAYLSDGTHLNDFGRRQFGEFIGGHLICGA